MRKLRQTVGPLVLKNFNFLKKITKTRSNKKRKNYLDSATSDELLSLVEIASNILNSNFILTNKQKSKLTPYAELIRKLARRRSVKGTKKIVNQIGEGAPALLVPLLAPVLIEAAHHLITKIMNKNGE
jgi:hypothetical protein